MRNKDKNDARECTQPTGLPTGVGKSNLSDYAHMPSTKLGARVTIPRTQTPLTGRNQSDHPLTQGGYDEDLGHEVYRQNQRAVAEYFSMLRLSKRLGCPGCDHGACVDASCPPGHRAAWGAR
jgi:hypothetical protein